MSSSIWKFAVAALSIGACSGENETSPPVVGAGGAGGQGGDEPCGARDTSDDPDFARLLDFTENWRIDNNIPGVAVGVAIKEGERWIEHTAGLGVRAADDCDPITSSTLFVSWSSSYLATELAGLAAVERDELLLDAPITDDVPSFSVAPSAHGTADDVTLRDLFDNTSGLPEGFFGLVGTAATWIEPACDGDGELASYFAGRMFDLYHPPGLHWGQSDVARALLGLAIENAAQKPFAQAVREDVFAPLGLQDVTYDLEEAQSGDYAAPHPSAAQPRCAALEPVNSLHASIRDELKLLEQVGGSALAPNAWDALYVQAPQASPQLTNAHPFGASRPLDAQTTLVEASSSGDGYQQCALIVPERGFAVAVLGNLAGPSGWHAPCVEALRLFTGIDVTAYDESTPPASWSEYTGVYVDPIGVGDGPRQLEVTLEGGDLVGTVTEEGSAPLSVQFLPSTIWWWFEDSPLGDALDPDVFMIVQNEKRVRFWRDDTGLPVAIGGTGWLTVGPHFFRQQGTQP